MPKIQPTRPRGEHIWNQKHAEEEMNKDSRKAQQSDEIRSHPERKQSGNKSPIGLQDVFAKWTLVDGRVFVVAQGFETIWGYSRITQNHQKKRIDN
jgi:hypothetical protein